MSLFLFFKNVYGLRVYGYTAAAKSATALQERTLAGRVFHSAGPRKNVGECLYSSWPAGE